MYSKISTKMYRFFCSNTTKSSALNQLALNVFVSNKTVISFSKNLSKPEHPKQFLNCYVNEEIAASMIIPNNIEFADHPDKLSEEDSLGVIRVILNAGIGNDQISLNINELKKNEVLKKLIKLDHDKKFTSQVARVIIDDKIQPTLQQKSNQQAYLAHIEKNMLEVEKLIETGLGLKSAYMISNKNLEYSQWITLLSKKRKAIHSNVVLVLQKDKFEELIYNQGYKLEHIFLKAYDKKGADSEVIEIEKIQDNNLYNTQEMINVLKMINFKGKIVLEDNQHFFDNISYLENILKKNGFSKKKVTEYKDNDDDNWFARI